MVVFLTGYMGSGKTSIGRKLAQKCGLRFVDMDHLIEEREGKTVAAIFAEHGEEYFRSLERQLLSSLCSGDENIVVSTGGGVPCFGDNMELMNSAGLTVYLRMGPEKLVSRLSHGRHKRPLIKGMDDQQLREFISQNLQKREPHYGRAALVLECDLMGDDAILERLGRELEARLGVK